MRYILSELDEQEREESFRLKRFKQLKYKKKPKGLYGDETEGKIADSVLLEEEEPEPAKPSPVPKKVTPLVIPPTPEVPPRSGAETLPKPPPKVEPIIPPTPKVQPYDAAAKTPPPIKPPPPKVKPIIPLTPTVQPCGCAVPTIQPCGCAATLPPPSPSEVQACGCALKKPPPPKVEVTIPRYMPAPEKEKAEPSITPGNQERLDHLMEHLNQILQIAEELEAAKQTPRIKSFIKCCGEVKGKIKDLSCAPSPRGSPKVCSETPGQVSSIPSICGEQPLLWSKPLEKPSAVSSTQSLTSPVQSKIQSDIFELEPVTKTTLGEFEKRFEEKVTVTRTKNQDGSIREEKQIITIQTETRTPRPEKYADGAKSQNGACGSGGENSGGKRGGRRGRGSKKRNATLTPSWTSKFSAARKPSFNCKTCGAQTPSSACNSQENSAYFSSNTSRIPSDICCTQVASKLSETSKTCGCAKPSVASKLSETPTTSVILKPCGCPKSIGAPRPSVTLKSCECPDTVPSYASVTLQPNGACTAGSSYYSTTASCLDSTSYTLPLNDQSSCVGSPKRPVKNKTATKSNTSSKTCSCYAVSVSEKQSKESKDPLKTKHAFKSDSNSADSLVQKLPEKLAQKSLSEHKSTYCIPDCGTVLMSKSASTQSKYLFALASPSASITNDSLNRANSSQSDCTRISSNTLEASIDDIIVVRGSRLNALRKMILPSDNSVDFNLSRGTTISKLSSYTSSCTSPQISASSIKNYKTLFPQNPGCLTCLSNRETEVESDIYYTHDQYSCGSQSASFKKPPEVASCVIAECRAAVAALAEHINKNAGLLSPGSSSIWYSTLGTPQQKDAMTSHTSYWSDSNQIEALNNDQGRESVHQLPNSSITDTYLEIEQDQTDLVQKVSSSSS